MGIGRGQRLGCYVYTPRGTRPRRISLLGLFTGRTVALVPPVHVPRCLLGWSSLGLAPAWLGSAPLRLLHGLSLAPLGLFVLLRTLRCLFFLCLFCFFVFIWAHCPGTHPDQNATTLRNLFLYSVLSTVICFSVVFFFQHSKQGFPQGFRCSFPPA